MNFFYRPTEIITKIAAADNDSEDIMDILSRILYEMNERAERCKKHDFEYGGLCIDDPDDVFICKHCGKEIAEGVDNSGWNADY